MDLDYSLIQKLWLPILIILGSVLIGVLVEKLLLTLIRKLVVKTKWRGDDMIIGALRGMPVFWILLIGVNEAIKLLNVSDLMYQRWHLIMVVCVIFSLTIVAGRFIKQFMSYILRTAESRVPAASIFSNLSRIFIYIIGILIILNRIGVEITPMLTALGVGGLAVALALQDTLTNLFAGIQILLSRQIRPGDFVLLDTGDEGVVQDVTLRNTTVKKLANNILIIPNSKLANALVTNYTLKDSELSYSIPVKVTYDSDLEFVEKVTIEVALYTIQNVPGAVPNFTPNIRYNEFSESGINFNVNLRVTEFSNKFLLTHEFIKNLHRRFKVENIQHSFPTRNVFVNNKL